MSLGVLLSFPGSMSPDVQDEGHGCRDQFRRYPECNRVAFGKAMSTGFGCFRLPEDSWSGLTFLSSLVTLAQLAKRDRPQPSPGTFCSARRFLGFLRVALFCGICFNSCLLFMARDIGFPLTAVIKKLLFTFYFFKCFKGG